MTLPCQWDVQLELAGIIEITLHHVSDKMSSSHANWSVSVGLSTELGLVNLSKASNVVQENWENCILCEITGFTQKRYSIPTVAVFNFNLFLWEKLPFAQG